MASHLGLDARVTWLDGERGTVRSLLMNRLLPQARQGLERLEIDAADIDRYLGIVTARISTGQTGTVWQRAYVARYGHNMAKMTESYRRHQDDGLPVHEWPVE
jgi:hypothetical protein